MGRLASAPGQVGLTLDNGGPILILETIMPDQPGPHWAKLLDIQMLTMHTGRERTRAEYANLLAEEKFHLERVIETSSDVQILEAIPV